MKLLISLCFVALVRSSAGTTNSRGCFYVLGNCYSVCAEGTHAYTTGCGYKTPEATCDNHSPVPDTSSQICDYSACYCDPPTVRDTTTKKCVPLEECPKKGEEKEVEKEVEIQGQKEVQKE